MSSKQTKEKMSYDGLVTKKDLRKVFWHSIPFEWLWNYERQANVGYCFGLLPVLKKLSKTKEELTEAMERNMEFYVANPHISTFSLGMGAALEEERVQHPETMNGEQITNIKSSMMAPLGAIGDSLTHGTLRIIATAIALPFAMQGSILGPILFALAFNVPHIIMRYLLTFLGYRLGKDVTKSMEKMGTISEVMSALAILGMIVIGAMAASSISCSIPISFGIEGDLTTIQATIDSIIPGLVPLGIFGIAYWLLKKKVSALAVMFIFMIAGTILALLGVIA